MINGVLIYSGRGELLVSNLFKSSVKRTIADIFRIQVINNLDVRSPILTLGSTTFHHIRSSGAENLWLVVVTRNNGNSAAIWEFLYKFETILDAYGLTSEDRLKEEFMTSYEILDVMLSANGIPLDTELSSVISKISVKPTKSLIGLNKLDKNSRMNSSSTLSMPNFIKKNTRALPQDFVSNFPSDFPWRPNGIKYKKNEIFLYVTEKINILVSRDETILKAYVDGTIELTSHLSGTPICQFGLNDHLSVEDSNPRFSEEFKDEQNISSVSAGSVKLEDCKFHHCVSLDKFHKDRMIKFVPPDGHMELMKYHVRDNLNFPFKISPMVKNTSSGIGLSFRITLKSLFPSKLSATDVVLRIPVPPGTVDCKIDVSGGKCRFAPEENYIIWKFKKYNGSTENNLSAVTISSDDTTQLSLRQWPRPPMSLYFEIVMFSNSGLVVTGLRIMEKEQKYRTGKWIKYISRSGSYEIRY